MNKYDESSLCYASDIPGVQSWIVKSNVDGKYYCVFDAFRCYNRTIEIDGTLYEDDRYITITASDDVCSCLSEEFMGVIIKNVIVFITSRGFLPDFKGNKWIEDFINKNDLQKFVKDIECFPFDGFIPLEDEDIVKLCIEKPVRNACKYLTENGVSTIMSSANRVNVENKDVVTDPNKLYIGQDDRWTIGDGYAWIMLKWDEMCQKNKDLFLEEIKKGSMQVKLYDYIDVDREVAQSFDFEHSKILHELNIDRNTGDKDFDAYKDILLGHNSLNNLNINQEHHRLKIVVLRYPIDELSETSEVESYFNNMANLIVENEKNLKIGDRLFS